MNQSWREMHKKVITDFLAYLNASSDQFILKGGTALMMCYNLPRFSEDIDLDSKNKHQLLKIVDSFCKKNGYTSRIAKNTATVQRAFIHYGNDGKPLKIELSLRNRFLSDVIQTKINGIQVYNIDHLCMLKTSAYTGRDKLRDLYDVVFICKRYWEELSNDTRFNVQNAFAEKGLEQFDYVIATQEDELIDKNALGNDFLEVYDKLGLIDDGRHKEVEKTPFQQRLDTVLAQQSGHGTLADSYIRALQANLTEASTSQDCRALDEKLYKDFLKQGRLRQNIERVITEHSPNGHEANYLMDIRPSGRGLGFSR